MAEELRINSVQSSSTDVVFGVRSWWEKKMEELRKNSVPTEQFPNIKNSVQKRKEKRKE